MSPSFKVVAVIGVGRDITKQKESELLKLKLEKELAQKQKMELLY